MKIRVGFVSNSSSSSFIIQFKNGETDHNKVYKKIKDSIVSKDLPKYLSNVGLGMMEFLFSQAEYGTAIDLFEKEMGFWLKDKTPEERNDIIKQEWDYMFRDADGEVAPKDFIGFGSVSNEGYDPMESVIIQCGIDYEDDDVRIFCSGEY